MIGSAEAVHRTAREFGGPDVKLYASQVTIRSAADGQWRHLTVITACRSDGRCTVIAPDGVSYPDVQSFVDGNKAIKPGDVVLANANLASPDVPVRLEEFTRSTGPPWVWIAGGGASVVVVVLAAVWLTRQCPVVGVALSCGVDCGGGKPERSRCPRMFFPWYGRRRRSA